MPAREFTHALVCTVCAGACVVERAVAGSWYDDASVRERCDHCSGSGIEPAVECECCGRPAVAADADGVRVCDGCLELDSEEHYERAYARLVNRQAARLGPAPIDVGPEGDSVDIELSRLPRFSRRGAASV